MTDKEALELLRLLHRYMTEEADSDSNMSIEELAADLAMSMDETTDEADRLYREIASK